ncbi:MAG: hypothetical protein LH481_10875 [Burkholderiales bacterium]|nr:hypothetical protein [Burkholderiales bacterium]
MVTGEFEMRHFTASPAHRRDVEKVFMAAADYHLLIDNNTAAFAFWRRMGFTETGERRPVEAPYLGAKVVLEKSI